MTVSKNIKTPMMTIFLRPPHNASKVAADRARSALATTTLRQLVLLSSIVFGFSPIYPDIVPSCVRVQWDTVSHAPWVLRLELDPRLMFCDQLTMIDIEYAVTSFYGDRVVCHTTDDNDDEMLVHIALRLPPDASADCVQSQLTELRALEKGLLESVCIKGIRGVAGMVLRKVDAKARYSTASQTYEPHVEWALVSEGTNLVEVLGCAEYVDVRRTVSNDVAEVLQVLGIEAARQALFNELSAVVQDADLFVQFHHLGLLCDTMTSHGTLVSMHRHGLNRNGHTGVLSRMSFEETCDMITKAGIFADKDPLTGVTANLMFGQLPPCGTGDSGVLLDDTLLPPNPVKQESAWEQALSFDSLALG
jgi:DNA-directed RNA polymerase II subunit RPB1